MSSGLAEEPKLSRMYRVPGIEEGLMTGLKQFREILLCT